MISAYLLITVATIASWFIDSSNMNVAAHAVVLGVVRGFFTVFVFYIAFIWLYFKLRKKWQKRYSAEIFVIGIVVVFSIVGKMLISYFNEVGSLTFVDVPRDAWDNTAKFYYAIYQALGGISFEGLAEYELYETWRTMIYAGGSLLAGAVAISILTFSISYEIYSFFSWKSFRGRKRAKIYIFTAVTEDAVTLAHSIDDYNKKKRKEQTFGKRVLEEFNIASGKILWLKQFKYLSYDEVRNELGKKMQKSDLCIRLLAVAIWFARTMLYGCVFIWLRMRAAIRMLRRNKHVIIFLRTEGEEGFDVKNALHADIMHSGFLFMSYNPGKKDQSITRFLHIDKANDTAIRILDLKERIGKAGDPEEKHYYEDLLKRTENDYRERLMRDEVAEVHIFALDWEKGKTSENDNIVSEDIARCAREVFVKGSFRQRIRRFCCEKKVLDILENEEDKTVSELRRIVAAKRGRTRRGFGKVLNKKDEKEISEIKKLLRSDPEYALKKIKQLLADDMKFARICDRIVGYRKSVLSPIKDTMAKDLVCNVVVNYHYLLSGEIDLPNADMRFDNELAKFRNENYVGPKHMDFLAIAGNEAYDNIGGRDKVGYALFYKNFKRHFILNAINEANMAAMLYVKARGELVRSCPDFYREDLQGEEYKAMIIGFGLNGQQTMKAAYIFAAAGKFPEQVRYATTDDDDWNERLKDSSLCSYRTQPFNADVYDKNAFELGGLFKMKNPSFDIELPSDRESAEPPVPRRNVYKYAPVAVRLYQESAYSDSILKMLDRNLGEDKSDYNLIVIALGDDDSNVSIANALLEDFKHEYVIRKEESNKKCYGMTADGRGSDDKQKNKIQVFAVNLRDKLNYDRINWCRKDEEDYLTLKVVIYGAAEDMYSYENIVDQSAPKIWNRGYAAIQGEEVSYTSKLQEDIKNVAGGNTGVTAGKYMKIMSEAVTNAAQIEIDWMGDCMNRMYSMISSKYASAFSPFATEYCRILERIKTGEKDPELKDVSLETLIMMGAVEHDRWIRFVISNGYIKAADKSKHAKLHPDIVPYSELISQPNDIINVLNALTSEQSRVCAQIDGRFQEQKETPSKEEK